MRVGRKHDRLLMAAVGCCLVFGVSAARAQAPIPGGRGAAGPPTGRGPGGGPPSMGGGSSTPANNSGTSVSNVNSTSHSSMSGGFKLGPSGRWWDDKTFRQQVGITHDQQKRMDSIFDANKQSIISTYEAYEKQKTNLDTLSKDPKVEQSKLFAAIDATNEAKTALQKARTQMLLQIRQQLGSDQIVKLDSLP